MRGSGIWQRGAAVIVAIFALTGPVSVSATPWLDAEELHVRHSLQVLADAGLLRAPVTTFPVLWRPLLADLEALDPAVLTELQQVAYYKLMALLNYHKGSAYTSLRVAGVTDTGAQPSYQRPMEGKASVALSHERIGSSVAGRLRTTYRDSSLSLNPRVRTDNLSWQGSYAAGMVGDWMFSVDQLHTWWSPGSAQDGLHTVSTLPLRSLRTVYAPSAASRFSALSFTAFYGESEEKFLVDPSLSLWSREEAFGARLGWRAHERLELGLHFTRSSLDGAGSGGASGFGSASGSASASDDAESLVFDARLSLPYQFNFYGSISEHRVPARYATSTDSDDVRGNGHMVGLDWSFAEPEQLSRFYAEHDRSDLRSLTTLGYASFRNSGLGWDFRIQDTRIRRDHNNFGRAARFELLPEFRPGIARIQQFEAAVFYPIGPGLLELGVQAWQDTYESGRKDEFGNLIASYELRW
ncbi:hypothetical protein J6J34_01025 [Pseudidiomarina sp. 1ASP75-14]|uniref:hypothetical protein n=1 Tax=Pseudidiomarina terrestris TaxID=2820060 RepID=UPI002653B9EC|nr:hypothetical protein [Pseudidiomarina sp. 1ASP75-14]MDN7136799.1 hypothetical protein [Pseudidiomarina sp. 1ASP75-14]